MSATVQATCPGCRNVLRIPAEWAEKALKCKKCGTVVQARRKASGGTGTAPSMPAAPTPAYPQPVPVPQPVIYAPPAYADEPDPFATDPESPTTKRYRRRRGGAWLNYLILFAILGGLGGAGYAFRHEIMDLAQPPAPTGAEGPQVAGPKPPPAPKPATDGFPRRLLFVHVTRYVYFNTLAAGKDTRGEDLPTRSANRMAFELRVPTDKENNQLFTLIDTGKDARPGLKANLKHAVEQFLTTSREQDRLVLYFGGHAVELDGKAYLVPTEGEPDDAATLVPVDEVYTQMKACKAQQKVLILDVCRFNPGFGAAKPGSEPMTDGLSKLLLTAPPGVQVLTTCGPKQNAQETTEAGSEFLDAFRTVAAGSKATKSSDPAAPVPADAWAKATGAQLSQPRDETPPQTVQFAGTEGAAVAVNRDEPPAKRFDWPALPKGAAAEEVARLLKLAEMPGIRKEFEIPKELAEVVPFAADKLKDYAIDGVSDEDAKDPKKYPVRAATLEALMVLRAQQGDGLRDSFEGAADERTKKSIAQEQEPIAKRTLDMRTALDGLLAVEKKLGEEKSKRWRTLYQYTLAQAQMRWAYLEEYNLSLGDIRTDRLGTAPAGANPVWRLVSVPKMKSKGEIKEVAEAGKELMGKLADEHKGTPWEVLAKMHKNVALGLAWKLVEVKKEEEPKPEMKKE